MYTSSFPSFSIPPIQYVCTHCLQQYSVRPGPTVSNVVKRPDHHGSQATPLTMTTPLLQAEERIYFLAYPTINEEVKNEDQYPVM